MDSEAREAETSETMRMGELVERTGVPKTTILYYIKEGLLPPPDKPYPNQARYTRTHVDRLLLIKEMQRTRHYPLAKIRRLAEMMDRGASPAAVAHLSERLFATRATADSDRRWTVAEFCAETGFDKWRVQEAVQRQLLNPLVREPETEFDAEDVAVAHALRMGERLGLTMDDTDFLVAHARGIAEGEMALRERVVAGRPATEDVELTAELTDIARTLHTYIVDRMFIAIASAQPVAGVRCEPAAAEAPGPTWTTNAPSWPHA